ncbi:hypothetical protein HKD37_07G020372 [Glycine soja]
MLRWGARVSGEDVFASDGDGGGVAEEEGVADAAVDGGTEEALREAEEHESLERTRTTTTEVRREHSGGARCRGYGEIAPPLARTVSLTARVCGLGLNGDCEKEKRSGIALKNQLFHHIFDWAQESYPQQIIPENTLKTSKEKAKEPSMAEPESEPTTEVYLAEISG